MGNAVSSFIVLALSTSTVVEGRKRAFEEFQKMRVLSRIRTDLARLPVGSQIARQTPRPACEVERFSAHRYRRADQLVLSPNRGAARLHSGEEIACSNFDGFVVSLRPGQSTTSRQPHLRELVPQREMFA